MSQELTPKQQRFVEEYLIDLNATQAAIRAGYSAKTARQIGEQNLSKLDVAKAIKAAMAARSQRTEVTQDYVLKTIVTTVERCTQARPVLNKQGEPVLIELPGGKVGAAYVFDPTSVLKGADMLARHVGLYEKHNSQLGDALTQFLNGCMGKSLPIAK